MANDSDALITATTIPELVALSGERFGDHTALVGNDVQLSFAELADGVTAFALSLRAAGIRPGDRVAIWAPNIWEWVIVVLGIHTAGAVAVPINTRFKGGEAAYVIKKSGAKWLFTVTDFLGINYVEELRKAEHPPEDLNIIIMRGPVPDDAASLKDIVAHEVNDDTCGGTAVKQKSVDVTGGDPCHIMFTSGTTGAPKAAVINHGAVCKSYRNWAAVIGLRADDRYLIVNPFFHSFGLHAGILACLMSGATMLPQAVFDVDGIMQRVSTEGVPVLPGPPAIYQTILNHPNLDSHDMSSLRLAVTGAAPVPVSLIEAMRERLGFEVIVTGYGLTETSGIVTMCRHDDPPEVISTTSGRAIDDVDVRVVGDDGTELPRGEPGEIVVRGYNVTSGYLDDPAATAETIDDDGWLHTGDMGIMNDDGYLTITDRLKDMYICGGFNAYPAEIESVLSAHPAIAQVAVIGVPDERLGEVGHAFITPTTTDQFKKGATTQDEKERKEELIAWAAERLANYKVPRAITFVDSLPLTASGKVQKHLLRESVS